MGVCKEVCKECMCTNWLYKTATQTICASYGNTKCSAHKWFVYCEHEELERHGTLEYFVGDCEEHGLEK